MNDWQNIVTNLKKELKAREISSYKLEKMTGLASPNIRRLLTLSQAPNLKTICLICNALSISLREIC
jgi:transcriptional regulator with XRE-family HTH domain